MSNSGRNPRTSDTLIGIERFLRGCFLRGSCEKIILRQLSVRGAHPVADWIITDEPEDSRTPEGFAALIEEITTQDANSLRGPTQYGVFVTRVGQDEPSWRWTFKKRGDSAEDGSFSETEPPDQVGLTSMAMRHAEAATRTVLQAMNLLSTHYQRILSTQDTRLEQLESRFIDVIDLHEKVSTAKEERDLRMLKERKSAEQKDRILDQVQTLAPAVLGKLLPAGPAKNLAIVEGMRELFRGLRPEQLESILSTLDEGQRAAVITAYQTFVAEEEAKEKKEAAE